MAPRKYLRLPARAILVLGLSLLVGWPAQGDQTASEYSVKAAFLYNFAQFIRWPTEAYPTPADPIVLAVYGEGDFPAELRAINGRRVPGEGKNRAIILKEVSDLREIEHCQILFVLRSRQAHVGELMRQLDTRGVLTVLEESGDLAETGAVINLYKTPEQRVRFEINVDAAKRADLKINSALLNLARIVRSP